MKLSDRKREILAFRTNPCCGPRARVSGTGGYPGSTYALAAANFVTFVTLYLLRNVNFPFPSPLSSSLVNHVKV